MLGPGGLASPREVAYRGMGDPGQILSDILAFHEAFAFRPEAEEPPDHVAVEAGFLWSPRRGGRAGEGSKSTQEATLPHAHPG